jgi:drug/metabolite transporter (DMT)-like permease
LGDGGLRPVQTTELRCLVAAVILLVLLAVFDRKLLKIEARDIWMFIGTGLLSISMFSILYFTAASLVTLSMAAVQV